MVGYFLCYFAARTKGRLWFVSYFRIKFSGFFKNLVLGQKTKSTMERLGTSSMEAKLSGSLEHFVRGIYFIGEIWLILYFCCFSLHSVRLVELLGHSVGANDVFDFWNHPNMHRFLGTVTSDIVEAFDYFLNLFQVLAIEAPFCCMFIDHVQQLSAKVEERPLWNRAAFYCG